MPEHRVDLTEETLGVIIYQDQVLQIAQQHRPATALGEADLLRRAMGKKKPEEMAEAAGASSSTGARSSARSTRQGGHAQVFDLIVEFAGYGFPKAHSTAYALHHVPDGLPEGEPPAASTSRRSSPSSRPITTSWLALHRPRRASERGRRSCRRTSTSRARDFSVVTRDGAKAHPLRTRRHQERRRRRHRGDPRRARSSESERFHEPLRLRLAGWTAGG